MQIYRKYKINNKEKKKKNDSFSSISEAQKLSLEGRWKKILSINSMDSSELVRHFLL